MKDLFYGLLSFMIIMWIIYSVSVSQKQVYEIPQYKGGVVIEKSKEDFVSPACIYILKSDTVHQVICYDILFNKYNVGDTVR